MMKFTLCLLLAALLATVSSVHGSPWIAFHHPAAAYNLVQPNTVPNSHWSAIVRSNLLGGSFAYSVHEGRAVHQHPAAVAAFGPQLVPSANVQPSVVAIHLANPAAGYPTIAGAVAPQWVVQPSLLPGGGGFTFIPAGAQLPGRPPVAAPGGPAAAAPPPPSVDADDVVTVSDEADEAAGNNAEQAQEPSTVEENADTANDVVAEADDGVAESMAADDEGADDSVSVESA